eukprot:TRINITY_DN4463_c0_g1_i1.p1 TRINITY_DN4463_c0_g1~~TRINITY_DN4463_c0_g1_i1.p1  ORF type:complete len:178 (+),score=6.02 TRINITY_DN4463_c0_g1_i1:149-682(+)
MAALASSLALSASTAAPRALVRCSAAEPTPSTVRVASSGLPAAFSRSLSLSTSATDASVSAAIDPSSAYMTAMWAKSTYNVQILVGESEATESVVRRFKKTCLEADIVNECRRRRFFETTQDIKKRKFRDAARQRKRFNRSNAPRQNAPFTAAPAAAKKAAAANDDDDDFWDAEVEL